MLVARMPPFHLDDYATRVASVSRTLHICSSRRRSAVGSRDLRAVCFCSSALVKTRKVFGQPIQEAPAPKWNYTKKLAPFAFMFAHTLFRSLVYLLFSLSIQCFLAKSTGPILHIIKADFIGKVSRERIAGKFEVYRIRLTLCSKKSMKGNYCNRI